MPGKQKVTHTPFLDAWRIAFIAATDSPDARGALATYIQAQRHVTRQSAHNLIARIRDASRLPNAEDFLTIDHWLHRHHFHP